MTVQTKRFQRKPFYVEAIQVTEENMAEVAEWCGGPIKHTRPKSSENVEPAPYIQVPVISPKSVRQTRGYVGDWVLKAGEGFKVYADKSFKQSFVTAPVVVNNDHNYGAYLAGIQA